MAFQLQAYRAVPKKISAAATLPGWLSGPANKSTVCVGGGDDGFCLSSKIRRRVRVDLKVKASLDATAAATVTLGKVTEVSKDTFWPIVKAAGTKIVVLDMYTQWCGPCRVMAPRFQELSEKYLDIVFLKLDCTDNKPLAKELGIRVVPTFKILKDNKIVKEVTGAKFDDLVAAIESVRIS